MLKSYLKSYLYLFSIIITLTIILSIINSLTSWDSSTIKIIIPIISLFISSIILGKNTKESAYIEGIKFSTIFLILITILKLILKTSFNYKIIIIYFTYLFSSILGSMLGINIKKNKS